MKIRILTRFVDEKGGKMYAPAIYDNERPEVAHRLIRSGLAVEVTDEETEGPKGPSGDKTPEGGSTPQGSQTQVDDVIPNDFPGRNKLAEAGINSMTQLKELGSEESLRAIPGIGQTTAKEIVDRLEE
jgi:hypothetical protein